MRGRIDRTLRALLALLVWGWVTGVASVSFPDDSVVLRTNFFSDTNGLLVRSPTVELSKDLTERSMFGVRYSLDRVRIPPIRGISGIPLPTDAVTGASRPADSSNANQEFLKNRNEVIATVESVGWSASGYLSAEADYVGRLISFGMSTDMNQKNTNISMKISYGWDTIKPTGRDVTFTRHSVAWNGTITQTLSKIAIMRFGVDLSQLGGVQSNPYRTVFVGGGYYLEEHPSKRLRGAGFFRLNRYFKGANASLGIHYRLYGDDWGVVSQTFGVKYYQNMSKRLMVRYRYRYYRQSGAYFYNESYPLNTRPRYFTADYKLLPLSSNLFGIALSYRLDSLEKWFPWAGRSVLEAKYERYFNSLDFAANIFQLGVTVEY